MFKGLSSYLLLFTATAVPFCRAKTDQPDGALAKAQSLSSLTALGSQPFHLKLRVSDPRNAQSPYTAVIEEYWKSPDDWYRTIDSPELKQLIIVTGGKRTEQNIGDYYPLWLSNFVNAATDPVYDPTYWKEINAQLSRNDEPPRRCESASFAIGTDAVSNVEYAAVCFNSDGAVSRVIRPGFNMQFLDPRSFGKKRIAYKYISELDPETTIEGSVDLLETIDLGHPLIAPAAFPEHSTGTITSLQIKQETLQSLQRSPETLSWPAVRRGNTSGRLSMYVSVDRTGRIREAYLLNADNTDLASSARDQLLKWQLKTAKSNGQNVQVEATLTFRFETVLDQHASINPATGKPYELNDGFIDTVPLQTFGPVYPEGLRQSEGSVVLAAIIDSNGHVVSLTPRYRADPRFLNAAIAAVQHWTYKPYLVNGVAVEFHTNIAVHFEPRPF